MKWWNILKVAGQTDAMGGETSMGGEGEIKPAETIEEARAHPVDPAVAEEQNLEKIIEWVE